MAETNLTVSTKATWSGAVVGVHGGRIQILNVEHQLLCLSKSEHNRRLVIMYLGNFRFRVG